MPEPAECLIAGGGPAGAASAILLARLGIRTTLVERNVQVHHKVCGEFLSHEALAYLESLGIDPWQLGAVPLRRVRLASDNLIAETTLPFAAASLSRSILDAALLRRVEESGTQVIGGRRVEGLTPDGSGWRMTLDNGQLLHGEQAMLATGKHDLRGHARGAGRQRGLVAFKMYLRLSAAQSLALAEAVEVVLFPGGYLGLQPTETGEANLCLLICEQTLRRLGARWPRIVEHLKLSSRWLRERLEGAEECFARPLALSHIPYGFVRKETMPGLWPLGDQAAVIPSFSGDGISIALHSAHRAASALTANRSAGEYLDQITRDVQRQVWQATCLSRLMVGMPQLAGLLRWLPSLLRPLAEGTRIPDEALLAGSGKQLIAQPELSNRAFFP